MGKLVKGIITALVVVGLIIFIAVMHQYQWDFTKLSTGNYETNTYTVKEQFHNISVNTDTADVTFMLSQDKICTVECYEDPKSKHSVAVQGDTLAINLVEQKAWYDYIGIDFDSPKIKISLPQTYYNALEVKESTGDVQIPKEFTFQDVDIRLSTGHVAFYADADRQVKIRTSTGSIRVENASVGALDLTASTGGITVSDTMCAGDAHLEVSTGKTLLDTFSCKNLSSEGDTGDISLSNVAVAEEIEIERSTGDVQFDGVDAGEIFVETDTGDVTGTLLSEKVFLIETDTGRVDVPKSITGGRCEISTDTGDIRLEIQSKAK